MLKAYSRLLRDPSWQGSEGHKGHWTRVSHIQSKQPPYFLTSGIQFKLLYYIEWGNYEQYWSVKIKNGVSLIHDFVQYLVPN